MGPQRWQGERGTAQPWEATPPGGGPERAKSQESRGTWPAVTCCDGCSSCPQGGAGSLGLSPLRDPAWRWGRQRHHRWAAGAAPNPVAELVSPKG